MNQQRLDQIGTIITHDLKDLSREAKALRKQLERNPPPEHIEYEDHHEKAFTHLDKLETLIPAATKAAKACTAAEEALVAARTARLPQEAARTALDAAEAFCLDVHDVLKKELARAKNEFNESQPN